MKPVSVTPTLAPREADDTAICARASLAGPSGYGHRSAASPPAARDGRGRLRRDGPRAGSGSCSGRSSSWRLHLHWTRASLVVLALPALVVAPGTIFAVAAAPDSDLVPVRGFRRLTQTTNDGGVEYLQRTKLNATDGAAYDYFGVSVSIDGDTVVIAAYQDDDKGSNSGSAYVYTRDTAGDLASGWTQVAKLTADDGADSDYFGYSVSIDGDTVVIGAHYDDVKGSNSGSAHVFTRVTAGDPASGWTQVAKLNATDGAAGDYFGYSVSIDGDTVVIGAYADDDKENDSGSAYVFQFALTPGSCSVSAPPRNGNGNDCVFPLAHGETCTPVCDQDFTAVTASAGCVNGNLFPGEFRCSRGYPRSYHGNWPCSIERRMEL